MKQNHLYLALGNFSMKARQGEAIALSCSFNTLYWTFNGKKVTHDNKYDIKCKSIEVRNVQTTDAGTYTCGDRKYYSIHLAEGSVLFQQMFNLS